ncbi:hypothetical protein ABIE26_002481 [Pedobacter africanus]|uniref:Uncharacterized protein n=1 Tax=Pedobacter africanus TaxID=151894 RepID=A0ACC6KY58_9SPHI|nr:hypothetical protein [Pedobacter africanus]
MSVSFSEYINYACIIKIIFHFKVKSRRLFVFKRITCIHLLTVLTFSNTDSLLFNKEI